ncbi:MAG: glycosyltransferase family 2 protein, partial [Candidatus Bilamarchaeaceae archaeon]
MGTKNEEKAIGKVIAEFKNILKGYDVEFVITDSSEDRTPEIARSYGAKVIKQEPRGYGIALRESLLNATGDIIITTDCDDTYPADAVPKMLKLIDEGYDVVSASRLLGKNRVKAMPLFNEIGNRIFALLLSVLYGTKCTDATTGMRAFKREVIQNIEWTENTGLSLELFFKPAVLGYKVIELPIEYKERIGTVKLNPIKGGFEMLKTLLKYKIKPIKKKVSKEPTA